MPVFTLVGGKWTTYRACAGEIADAVVAELELTRRQPTTALAIGGGHGWPAGDAPALADALIAGTGVDRRRAGILVGRHGSPGAVLAGAAAWPGDAPLGTAPDYTTGEIAWLAREERVPA